MLELSVGKGRQVTPTALLQYYATVATERAGYEVYRALVLPSEAFLHTGAVERMGNGWRLTLLTHSFILLSWSTWICVNASCT